MKYLRMFGGTCCILVLSLAILAPNVQADTWNKKTIITIDNALQIPGTTLAPGKYVFKLADSSSNRHIVQVFNADETQVLATILAIPNQRLQPTGKSEFGFWETPKGTPTALRSWFYPGDNFGQEFPYPKQEATILSTAVGQEVPVLSEEDQAQLARSSQEPSAIDREKQEPVTKEEPKAAESQVAAAPLPKETPSNVEPTPERTVEPSTEARPMPEAKPAPERPAVEGQELPKTGSFFPLAGLAGLCFLGMAFVVRMVRGTRS